MTSPALLLLAACALAAPALLRAASIVDHEYKKILAPLPDDIKEPLPANHEIIAPAPATEIGNEIRVKPEDIPVEVVVEYDGSPVKINEVDDDDIKRQAVDLQNPGPPQRQEHETQNPERHSDEKLKLLTFEESIERTQSLMRESFQGVSDTIQNWFYTNDGQNQIQKNIQSLRDSFTSQIQKLNDTIQTLAAPDAPEPIDVQGVGSQKNYDKIQSRLKALKEDFYNDVETFSAGVELAASLKSSADEKDAVKEETPAQSTPPATSTDPPNFLMQMVTTLGNRMNATMVNFQQLVSNTFNPSTPAPTPAGAQADTPAASPVRPPSWLPNWNIVQQLTNITSNRPNIVSNFQNGIANIFGFQSTAQPAVSSQTKPGEAVVKPADPVVDSPAAAAVAPVAAAAPGPEQAAQPAAADPTLPDAGGPIRQFLNNIPVVQRIQNSLTNRDTPRDPVQKSDGQSKGGWFGPPGKPGGSGDNNGIGVNKQKSEEVKEPIKEESKEDEKKTELRPESVPEKTD